MHIAAPSKKRSKAKSRPKLTEPIVRVGTGVIVWNNGKVLVGKRKGSHGAGYWALPGGHLDYTDKTLKACGEREVFEETGITCNVFSPDNYRQDLFTTYDILSEDGSKIYTTCYLVAEYLIGGKVTKDKKGREMILPREPKKCEGWYWKSLGELAADICTPNAKTWIPVNQVVYYLQKMWKEKTA